jgi:polyisoprenoid-binding protein YceI
MELTRAILSALLLLAGTAQAGTQTYVLLGTPAPQVRFTLNAPLDSILGSSKRIAGTVKLDPAAWASGTGRVEVDLSSFRTGVALRDEDLRDQFFEADRFRSAVLTINNFDRISPAQLTPDQDFQAEAVGIFSLHGIERPVRVSIAGHATEQGGQQILAVRGTFSVALADYRIQRPSRLFLKVGEVAQVDFSAAFASPLSTSVVPSPARASRPEPSARPAGTARATPVRSSSTTSDFMALPAARIPARPRRDRGPSFEFAFNTPEGRGERLFHDSSIGGPGNLMTCESCHANFDERSGLVGRDGFVRPDRPLYDSYRRASFWQGLAKGPGKAASMCARMFLMNPQGLDEARQRDLAAYLEKISPDAAPDLDYRALFLTKRTGLSNPLGGDPRSGARLERRYCEGCHAEGKMRPPLTPGLYEPDFLVRRVRWLEGHDSVQMPPMYIDRLTDTELRDIVSYLADESQRIFKRRPRRTALK